ncbi:hypothetical protein CW703_06715, partial [Candidatus Bathyarchaeota archaeon]
MSQVNVGKEYSFWRVSWDSRLASAFDKARLENLGFEVYFFDFPPEVKLTAEQHKALFEACKRYGGLAYRPDFIVYGYGKLFFWETKHRDRDVEEAIEDRFFIVPFTQYYMLKAWRKTTKKPVYLSIYFNKDWLGVQDIKQLTVLQEIYSNKHHEKFVKISLN